MVGTEIASFTVCEDPALNARHGDRLRFEQVLPHFELTPRFADIKNWDVFQGILLAVTSSDSSDDTILGSATMVAPGIALSATHNLADILPELRRGGMTMMCIGIASTGASLRLGDSSDTHILRGHDDNAPTRHRRKIAYDWVSCVEYRI
jgi:hypothetical protein